MKKILLPVIILLAGACSSTKYAANFQSNRPADSYTTVTSTPGSQLAPIDPVMLSASKSMEVIPVTENKLPDATGVKKPVRKTYFQMTKVERRDLRKHLKSDLRKYVIKAKGNSAPAGEWSRWDHDLKLAAIFGAIGTTGLIINVEPFFIIGAVALIIGVVFLVKWLVRQ